MFQIGDPSEMIVESSISEVDVGRLEVGQEVKIVADSFPEDVYSGKVKYIAPAGQILQGSNIVTFEVKIEIEDHDAKLKPGMSCDIDIIFDTRENVLVIPVEAVYEVMKKDVEGEETTQVDYRVVYRWEGEDFKEVRIETGLESSTRIEIISGLSEEDEVSLEASMRYKEFRDKESKAEAERTIISQQAQQDIQ